MKKDEMKKTVTWEEAVVSEPAVPTILMSMGMDRIGIPLMRGQTIEDICNSQDIDPDEAMDRINEFIRNKKASKPVAANEGNNHERNSL